MFKGQELKNSTYAKSAFIADDCGLGVFLKKGVLSSATRIG